MTIPWCVGLNIQQNAKKTAYRVYHSDQFWTMFQEEFYNIWMIIPCREM